MRLRLPILASTASLTALGGMLLLPGSASAANPVTAAPAVQAYEWDTAVSGGTPPQDCLANAISRTGSEACFERYGDVLWVKDTSADGHSATNSWDNYLADSGGNWTLYRQGSCVNKLGSGKWGYCNKDFYENSSANAYGGRGSSVDYAACVYDSADGTWHGCSGSLSMLNDQ
ncbi:hypothetical protein [Streptomyces cinerochromogenes]|uniref:hypothetical protein n=1 Tax=Streptomyces cinerochromogenes TaxID=66422 RepID=UPI0033A68E62